jgi:hypothetical protein
MSELRDLLEEKRRRFTMPQDSFRALQGRRERRRNRRVFAGVLALLIAGAVVGGLYRNHLIGRAPSERTAAQPRRSAAPGSLNSCKFIATFEGRTYAGLSVAITPMEGVPLGSAEVPGCNDTGGSPAPSSMIPVSSLPGVPASDALVMPGNDDTLLVRDSLRDLPSAVLALTRPPSCRASDEPIVLNGQWLGILSADGETELDLIPPYDLSIHVASASNARYERAQLTIRVPPSLGRPISHADVENSLWKGGSIAITAGCDGSLFVAIDVHVLLPAP